MMIFILERLGIDENLKYVDEYKAMIVRDRDESAARRLASGACGDEGPAVWLDPGRSDCRALGPDVIPPAVLVKGERHVNSWER